MLVFIFINPPLVYIYIYTVIFHAAAAFTTLFILDRIIYIYVYKVISFSLYLFFRSPKKALSVLPPSIFRSLMKPPPRQLRFSRARTHTRLPAQTSRVYIG